MNYNNISVGTDIEEINRFEGKELEKDRDFLARIFTEKELEYSYRSKNYAQHLCARFCAKEAVVKALSSFNITDVYYSDIEILNNENGAPYVNLKKEQQIEIKVSLSHCKTYATATVLAMKKDN